MRKIIFCLAFVLALVMPPYAFAQTATVINAVDNDPENRLWNCETNRVPFGNQETDRSRCFTFRYRVPRQGISSATVHISLDTLGSLQDTDATIVAVDTPVENCAWGQGSMTGCVVLHGGFKGGEKSLNLNLLNITCDASVPNTPENQQLVLQALQSGVLHMELQDDTAVYSAELVLNGGAPSFTCGTSTEPAATVAAASARSTASSATTGPLDTNPLNFLVSQEADEILTGTSDPTPPDLPGAAAASVAGALALAILAASNYLVSSDKFVQSARSRALRRQVSATPDKMAGPGVSREQSQTVPAPQQDSDATGARGMRTREHKDRIGARPVSARDDKDAMGARAVSAQPDRDAISARPLQVGGEAGSPTVATDASAGAASAGISPQPDASSGAGVGSALPIAPTDVGAVALDKAVAEGVSSVPDISDLVKDKLIEKAEKREKRERLQADEKRLQEKYENCLRKHEETRDALKRTLDGVGDFEAARRAWQLAEHERDQAQTELANVRKQLAALDEKKKEE